MKRIKVLFSTKFLIVYLYAVFVLNIMSIFYMDRATNTLDNQSEFIATLLAPLFLTFFFSPDAEPLSDKAKAWLIAGLVVACPIIFFMHIIFNL